MDNLSYGFKEVILNQSSQDKWKEIILNTGGTQSTLQDIKLPERAGGYWYKDSSKFFTRNRFIYWRLTSECVELCEASLDVTLSRSHLRLRPPAGSPALACWAYEGPPDHVTIFFATVTSLHRIQLQHPHQLYNKMRQTNSNVFPSIFQDVTSNTINQPSNIHILSQNASIGALSSVQWACIPSGEAAAALVGASGGALLVKLPLTGSPVEVPLKRDSSLLSTIAGALRGRTGYDSEWGGVLDATPAVIAGVGTLRGYCACSDGSVRSWGDASTEAMGSRRVLEPSLSKAALRPAGPMLLLYARSDNDCRVVLMRPDNRDLTVLKIIYAPQKLELVEMCGSWGAGPIWRGDAMLSGHEGGVWCLWSAADGYSLVLSHSFASGEEWRGVWSASGAQDVPSLTTHAEYAAHLTAPGLFPDRVLRKALAMCRHAAGGVGSRSGATGTPASPEAGPGTDESLSEPLADALTSAAEARCLRAAAHNRTPHDLMHRCWSEMYNWCVQYMDGLEKPLGLIVSEDCGSGGSWCINVRRGALGLIWPLPPLHSLLLADCSSVTFDDVSLPDEGVRRLVSVAGAVDNAAATLEVDYDGDNKDSTALAAESTPDQAVAQLALRLREDADFQMWVEDQLSRIPDLQQSVLALDEMLKLHASEIDLEGEAELIDCEDDLEEWDCLFASELGVSLVTETLDQMAAVRASVCRGVLVATSLWGASGGGGGVGGATAIHLQAFSLLRWLHRAPCPPERRPTQAQELLGAGARTLLGVTSIAGGSTGAGQRTVAGRWVGGAGGRRARHALRLAARATSHRSPPLWHQLLDVYATCLGSMLWGISDSFTFGWWLASVGEPHLVKKYVQLMEPWCEWNARSRQVILGLSHLELGEAPSALAAFCRAAPGVRSEPFLQALVAKDLTPARALVAYYLKVMKLFELQGASECVLQLAETTIGIADRNDPNLAMLHSVVFRAALEWGGEEGTRRALAAAARHPAPAQRNSAAATLLAHLAQRGELSILCCAASGDSPSGGVTAALCAAAARAAETRARLADAVPHNPYYDFLFALHTRAGRPRKAAVSLYERAVRCAVLPASEAALRRRSRCLLVALHCLRLAPAKHAFLLRPAPTGNANLDVSQNQRHKRLSDGNSTEKKLRQIAIGPEDLKRELDIVLAQLAFAQKSPQKVCPNDDPQSLGVDLCAVGAAGAALTLGTALTNSSRGAHSLVIAQAVTSAALSSLASECLQRPNDSLNTKHRNAADEAPGRAWRELRACMESAASRDPGSSHAHAAITSKLLSMGAFLPHWLRSQHMKLNAGELISLLLWRGRLSEAAEACEEALSMAASNAGGAGGLHGHYPPLTAIDNVLDELRCHVEDDAHYDESYKNLNRLVDQYIEVAKRRSQSLKEVKFSIFAK